MKKSNVLDAALETVGWLEFSPFLVEGEHDAVRSMTCGWTQSFLGDTCYSYYLSGADLAVTVTGDGVANLELKEMLDEGYFG